MQDVCRRLRLSRGSPVIGGRGGAGCGGAADRPCRWLQLTEQQQQLLLRVAPPRKRSVRLAAQQALDVEAGQHVPGRRALGLHAAPLAGGVPIGVPVWRRACANSCQQLPAGASTVLQ